MTMPDLLPTPATRRCGHERTEDNTCDVSAGHPGGLCRVCKAASQARYKQTDKGRAKVARYQRTTDKGRATQARGRARHRQTGKRRATDARYKQTDKGRATIARYHWARSGIPAEFTWSDYQRLLLAQGRVCALCGTPPRPEKRLDVDHDHVTGIVRGLLHNVCNLKVGRYEAGCTFTPTLAAKVAAYLKRINTCSFAQ